MGDLDSEPVSLAVCVLGKSPWASVCLLSVESTGLAIHFILDLNFCVSTNCFKSKVSGFYSFGILRHECQTYL